MPDARATAGFDMWTGTPSTSIDAGIQAVHAADALDERRLAGAVVAEQGQDLSAVDVQVDVVEGEHGAESLGRAGDGEHAGSAALMTPPPSAPGSGPRAGR